MIEDLGSQNGTFVKGRRIERIYIRPGDDVTFGQAALPWSDRRLRDFLRAGATGDTVAAISIPGNRFICGACGARGVLPPGFKGGRLRCGVCGEHLEGSRPRSVGGARALVTWAAATVVVLGLIVWAMSHSGERVSLSELAQRLGLQEGNGNHRAAKSPQEASIRAYTAERVVSAIDPTSPVTRNTAAQLAAESEGTYHVEQVARIWSHVRDKWRYVNDPKGSEYFARASETIENDYIGDCDDFAIVLSGMLQSIGGETRVIMMDGPRGGHAYAEACIRTPSEEVRDRLTKFYRRTSNRPREVHYRPAADCDVWLNLDWNAGVPGGPYEPELWAVAIYPDGTTETLAPAGVADTANAAAQAVPASALPPGR